MLMDRELSRRSYAIAMGIKEQIEKVFGEVGPKIESKIEFLVNNKADYDKVIREFETLAVNQVLLLDQQYKIKIPDIPWVEKGDKGRELSKEFVSNFTNIEMKEIKGAFKEAVSDYIKLRISRSSNRETAIILNAIARSYKKLGKQDEAIAAYKEICKGFSEERGVNGTSLGAVAYLQCAGISLDRGEIKEALDFYNSLLKDALSRRLECTYAEALFYKETVEGVVDTLIKQGLVKDDNLASYNSLVSQFDDIIISQEIAGILKEKNLLKDADTQQYSYTRLNDKTLVGYKTSNKYKDIIVFSLNIDRLKENIVNSIKQALRYTEEFEYEITDSSNQIFLSSLGTRLINPIIQEPLIKEFPGWQIRVRVKESEVLRRNAQLRMYINIGIIVILLMVIGISIYYMFKMMHRERELSKMKTDFVSSVSHEMRTPLTTIRMIGEMFQMGSVKDEALAREYYDTLSGETERLTRLINKVLDFSRMDSGRKRYNFTLEDIDQIITSTVKAFEKYAEANGYIIKLNIQENLPKIKIDADAISQVILNLLDNAMKYSPVNKEINVNAYKKEENIVIDVIDKGIGIEPAKIDRIFEKFYRGEDELTRETKGTGVGLSIVKHIVDAHKGKIEIESKKGEGSTFSVILPL